MKKWFDNWRIEHKPYLGKIIKIAYRGGSFPVIKKYKNGFHKGVYIVDLPFSFGEKKKFIFYTSKKTEDKKIKSLIIIIQSCLYELTSKKWYQFWRK